jgi:hypothetical protein
MMWIYTQSNIKICIFCVCVGVMYSGEYDVCDVTLPTELHGQVGSSYFGSESSSFDISVFYDMIILCVLVLCTQGEYDVCDVTLSVHPHRAS